MLRSGRQRGEPGLELVLRETKLGQLPAGDGPVCSRPSQSAQLQQRLRVSSGLLQHFQPTAAPGCIRLLVQERGGGPRRQWRQVQQAQFRRQPRRDGLAARCEEHRHTAAGQVADDRADHVH